MESFETSSMSFHCKLTLRFLFFGLTATLPSYSVLVATTTSMWQFFMDTKQNEATFKKVQIGAASMLVALDYNPADRRVYWSDVAANKIYRMSLSGRGEVQTLHW